jgi:hypothetical protein
MGYAKYIGGVGALALALGHWDSTGRNALGSLRESVHLRVVLGLCIDDVGGFDLVDRRGALRHRGGIVGLRPVDGVRTATEPPWSCRPPWRSENGAVAGRVDVVFPSLVL